MLKYVNTLLLACCILAATGQQKNPTVINPHGKTIDSLLNTCRSLYRKEPAIAKQLLAQAESLAQQANDQLKLAEVGYWKCRTNQQPNSQKVDCYKQVLEDYKRLGNEASLGEVYYQLGNAYDRLSTEQHKAANTAEALQHYYTALSYFDRFPNPTLTAITLSSIGGFYLEINDPKCIEYFEKQLRLRLTLVDSSKLSSDFGNLGVAYSVFNEYQKAIEYTIPAIKITQQVQDKRKEAAMRLNLANYLIKARDKDLLAMQTTQETAIATAIDNILVAMQLLQEVKAAPGEFLLTDLLLGTAYTRKHDFSKAIDHFHAAMSSINAYQYGVYKLGFYEGISEAYAGLGKKDSAYLFAKLIPPIKDSLNQNELRREILKKEVDYEFTRIAAALKQENSNALAQLKEQQLISQKQQQEIDLKQALLELNARQKEIDRLAILQADAALRTTQLTNTEKERQLTIANQQKDIQAGKLRLQQSQLNLQTQKIQAQKRSQWYLLGGLLLVMSLAIFIILNYKNRQKTKAMLEAERQKTQKAETVRRMAEFEMHGLRAQLNPHFMFNSLNAIQEQILREANDKASDYLTIFARMLRQLLENAERSFISLDKEIEFLQLYLFMEKLRMADLDYDIYIDPSLKAQEVMIPNMILQPYLENAIWHGLSLKAGERRIQMKALAGNNCLLITIEDNGIGRAQAALLNKKYRKKHHSKGMELLRKRFNLMKVEYGSDIAVEIVDLHDNNSPTGTRVELSIPYTLSGTMHDLLSHSIYNN